MGNGSNWSHLREQASRKWQLPLLAVSLVMLGGGLYRLRPTPRRIPFQEALAYLDTLVTGRFHDRALEVGAAILQRPDLDGSQKAQAELRMGRALFGAVEGGSRQSAAQAARIVDYYRAATGGGQDDTPLTADDLAHVGRAMEWQGQFTAAMEYYRRSLETGPSEAVGLRKHMYLLQRDQLNALPEVLSLAIDAFMESVPEPRLDLRFWALEEKLHLLNASGETAKEGPLLAAEAAAFMRTDFEQRFHFLECEALARAGQSVEAELCLRAIRNVVDALGEESAMAGWLLGRVLTEDEELNRPLEGLSFFDDVLRNHANGTYAVASRAGRGEALARLGRHEEAVAAYREAIKELPTVGDTRVLNPSVLRASLAVMSEMLRQAGQLRPAVEYAELAVELTDRGNVEQTAVLLQSLAQMETTLADQLSAEKSSKPEENDEALGSAANAPSAEARLLFSRAAQRFEELAALSVFDEKRGSEFSWRSAESYARAGDRRKAIERYDAFLTERPDNPLAPRALLRIGRLRQAAGELSLAVEAYRDCFRRFSRSLDGARALVPLARSYMAMGPDQLDSAEKTLRVILEESDVFTPEAPEFVDGLFLLGDVLERRGDFEQAIARLQEALDRYPVDPRVGRARFLLADSYRKSATALRTEAGTATFEAEVERVRAESTARFRAARELYRGLIRDLESRPPGMLDRLEQLYLHHAYLYEADCYFETQEYEHALKLYEQAAGNLRDTARGLAAYVQMVNCYVFMGEPREARAALARALVVVKAMPDSAFESRVSADRRGDWKKYFEWLGESELF